MSQNPLAPVHPGEIPREEFLASFAMSPYALEAELHVPRTRIERLVREETAVTPGTALRLARYFGTTPEFWLGIPLRRRDRAPGRQVHWLASRPLSGGTFWKFASWPVSRVLSGAEAPRRPFIWDRDRSRPLATNPDGGGDPA